MKFPIGMYRIHDKFIFDITVTIYDTLILYIYMISIYMMCFISELVLSDEGVDCYSIKASVNNT